MTLFCHTGKGCSECCGVLIYWEKEAMKKLKKAFPDLFNQFDCQEVFVQK